MCNNDWDGDSELDEVVEQLKTYFKCTGFYEEQIPQLYSDYHKAMDGDPDVASNIQKKLFEANRRYNHLVRDGIEYIRELEYKYPDIFQQNISELEMREGWYDPYLNNDDSELFD